MKYFTYAFLVLPLLAWADSYVQIYCPKPTAINSAACNEKSAQKKYNYLETEGQTTETFTSSSCVPHTSKLEDFKAASLTPIETGYYLQCEYSSSDHNNVYLGATISSTSCDLNGNRAYYKCPQSNPKNCVFVCKIS